MTLRHVEKTRVCLVLGVESRPKLISISICVASPVPSSSNIFDDVVREIWGYRWILEIFGAYRDLLGGCKVPGAKYTKVLAVSDVATDSIQTRSDDQNISHDPRDSPSVNTKNTTQLQTHDAAAIQGPPI